MAYCYFNNGLSMKSVPNDYQAQSGESVFNATATPQQLTAAFAGYAAAKSKDSIKAQIDALEATQTLRRMREAAAGTDNGWLDNLNAQITTLRGQLS